MRNPFREFTFSFQVGEALLLPDGALPSARVLDRSEEEVLAELSELFLTAPEPVTADADYATWLAEVCGFPAWQVLEGIAGGAHARRVYACKSELARVRARGRGAQSK